ncbi:MAG: 16S rRNA (guanine(527)-N(7))-methyltransferase RsmG [Actinomycetes bacterium]
MKRDNEKAIQRRLADLCSAHDLDRETGTAFRSVLESLADEHAPTAVRDPSEGVNVHIADSLSGLESPELQGAELIADIGSGCGIPGLVLAVALPQARVIAVEASGRRCEFIEAAASRAGIGNIEAVKSRAEEWSDGLGKCDLVVARAVAPLAVLAEYAAPLLKPGGALVAWKGTPEPEELEAAGKAAVVLGLEQLDAITVKPWPGGGRRQLQRLRKVGPTPAGYPRRAGMATKRPLGQS